MRRSLLRYLVCPACAGELTLEERIASAEWVEEGLLRCAACGVGYPVRAGVPRFPVAGEPAMADATARTRRTYDFTWNRVGAREIAERWEKDSYRYVELIPPSLMRGAGKVGLEAGCGGGADLLRIAHGGAELIGVDLSEGVEAAARACRQLPNVHVVQADIHQLPFRPGTFDFIYSFGVLHHLPDPEMGAVRLARLLKPGAPLVTYLYEDFGDRSAGERAVLAVIRGIRTVTSRLPSPVLLALCWLGAPLVWLCCSVPAHLLTRRLPNLAGRIPFRHTLRWRVLASDLFDRFAPPIERRYSRDGVLMLYRLAGCEWVETRRYRGWVSWGFRTATEPQGAGVGREAAPVGSSRTEDV